VITGAPPPKLGGKARLRVLVAGGDDVRDGLFSRIDGGQGLARGLRERVAERYGDRVAVDAEYLRWEAGPPSPVLIGRVADPRLDVAVLTVAPAARDGTGPDVLRAGLETLIGDVKAVGGPHLLVWNTSSVVPGDRTSRYRPGDEPLAIRAHRLNLVLMELSVRHGISIVDVDRVIGELGAAAHVREAFRYSAEASDALGEETLRILEDIGFFEARPLVAQIGRRRG
jgi:hypothetical protein